MGSGAGRSFGSVEVDGVRATLGRHAHVVVHARGAQLELDRDLVVGRLADLLDLQREIIWTQPVGVPGRRALVDPDRERAHLGHLLGDLLAHQMPAQTDLAALADEELDAIGQHQVVRIEAVAALDHLVVPLGRKVALGRDHPALARAGRGAGHRRAFSQRHLGLERQRAEAHPGDVDRDVELQRLLREACPEHGPGRALLAVALDHEPGQRSGQEHQLVPVRDRLEHREPAHPVAPELGLDVDVVDHLGGEDPAVTELVPGRSGRSRRWQPSQHHLPSRSARASRSCRASCRTRTSRARADRPARRSRISASRTRYRRRSTRRARSRSRATPPCLRHRARRRTSSRRGRGRRCRR